MIRFAIPRIGGAAWLGGWMYMLNLVRTLAKHGDPEIETVVFLGPDSRSDAAVMELHDLPRTRILFDPAFSEDRVRSGIRRTLLSGRNGPILRAYRKQAIDVALAPTMYLGWRSEIASIAWMPDFQHRRLPHLFGKSAWWKREIGFRLQVASSTAIMLSSAAAESDCLDLYPAAKGRTHVARFSVPVDDWPDADAAWAELRAKGVPDDFVFMPNQFWRHKNHRLAIEAAAILASRGSARVILATGHGDDPRRKGYRAELEQLIAQLGAGNNIRIMGYVDHSQVRAMTMGANALVNPSRFEGWSTTVEEAKAVGTPLLLSDIRVHREQAPGAGFFGVDDAEALADAIEASPPRSLQQLQVARVQVQHESLARQNDFALALSKLVREVASKSGKEAAA